MCVFCCRSSNEQRKRGSVKSDQPAGQDGGVEEDEYGGSTDDDPEEIQSTAASSLPSRGKPCDIEKQ